MRLLEQAVVDRENLIQRGGVGHIGQLFGGIERAERRYPVEWSWEQLLSCGRAMRAPVTEIALSADSSPAVRYEAVIVLARLDGAVGLDVAARACRAGYISLAQFGDAAHYFLPWCLATGRVAPVPSGDPLEASEARAKALLEIALERHYEDLLLESLDCVMAEEKALGGLEPIGGDERVRRWLNRIYDQDIDEWLARVAPAALEYRNRELKKGYDPVTTFADFAGPSPTRFNDEAIAKVIRPEDREVAKQLMLATSVTLSPTFPPRTPGWEDRLRAWYRENRPYFKYDPDKLRLVVVRE